MAAASRFDLETATTAVARPRRKRRWVFRGVLAAFALTWAAIAFWNTHKPMPPGTDVASPWVDTPLSQLRLLTDTTVTDGHGRVVIRQQIFDEVFRVIDSAQQFIALDFFLFNDQRGAASADDRPPHRALSSELKTRLIARKHARPDLKVLFITDPINDVYGGTPSADLAELRAAGIDVVVTDLDRLRDSNALYSALWRMLVGWWSKDASGDGWLPNPLETGPSRVTLRAWLRLLNFKANHRKLIVADSGPGQLVGIVASGNPHDASSAHSNIGLRFSGALARAVLASELKVARFSGWSGDWKLPPAPAADGTEAAARVKFVTEGAIRSALLNAIRTTQASESITIAVFYLADREVVEALAEAASREVRVRLILDPNKDAFGYTKDGVPNRPVAAELTRQSAGRIQVRWYRTHGEQFHTKLAMVRRADSLWVTLGSANFTRRNLANYNLEANLVVETDLDTPLAQQLVNYFETLWQNDALALLEYTTDFPTYEDQSFGRYWRYRLMEATGLSTF